MRSLNSASTALRNGVDRQLDLKNRSLADARPALQLTSVGFHDRATDPQAHVRALGREHRLKDFFHIFGGNSDACVSRTARIARESFTSEAIR